MDYTTPSSNPLTLLYLAGLMVVAGCGKDMVERGTVSGQVTLDGKPLDVADIVFVPIERTKGQSVAAKVVGGSYAIEENGPPIGKYRVEIYAYRKTGRQIPDLSPEKRMDANRPMIDEKVPYLPTRYNEASELTWEVKPGANDASFALASGKR